MSLTQPISLQNKRFLDLSEDYPKSNFSSLFLNWMKNFDLENFDKEIIYKTAEEVIIEGRSIRVLDINETSIKLEMENISVKFSFTQVTPDTLDNIIDDYSKKYGIQALNYEFWNNQISDIIIDHLFTPLAVNNINSQCDCDRGINCFHVNLGIVALGVLIDTNPLLYLALRRVNLNNLRLTLTDKRLNHFSSSVEGDNLPDSKSSLKIHKQPSQENTQLDQSEVISNFIDKDGNKRIPDKIERKKFGWLSSLKIDDESSHRSLADDAKEEPTFYYQNQLLKAVLFDHKNLPQKDQFRKIKQLQKIKGIGPVFAKSFLDSGIDSSEKIAQLNGDNRIKLENSIPSSRLDKIIQNAKNMHQINYLSSKSEKINLDLSELRVNRIQRWIKLVERFRQGHDEIRVKNKHHTNFDIMDYLKDQIIKSQSVNQFETMDDRIGKALNDDILSFKIDVLFPRRVSITNNLFSKISQVTNPVKLITR